MGGKSPQCSWVTDYYTNWLTQNAINIGLEAGLGVAGAGASLATGNVVGAGMSLVSTIGNIIAENHRASMVADQVNGNINRDQQQAKQTQKIWNRPYFLWSCVHTAYYNWNILPYNMPQVNKKQKKREE